jgi:hypothetical protein
MTMIDSITLHSIVIKCNRVLRIGRPISTTNRKVALIYLIHGEGDKVWLCSL